MQTVPSGLRQYVVQYVAVCVHVKRVWVAHIIVALDVWGNVTMPAVPRNVL